MSTPVVAIYVRHSKDCPYKEDEFWKRCTCWKHLRWRHDAKQHRRATKSRTWAGAEREKREVELSYENALNGQPKAANEPVTVRQAIAMFTAKKAKRAKGTLTKYRQLESNTDWEVCGVAENGDAALNMVRELRPDIMVLDLAMPGMNGLEVAREIRARAPGTQMIMFAGNDCEALLKEAQDPGISRVIAKSGDRVVDHLLAAIRDAFHKRDAA